MSGEHWTGHYGLREGMGECVNRESGRKELIQSSSAESKICMLW